MIRANELNKNAAEELINSTIKEWLEIAEELIIETNQGGKDEYIDFKRNFRCPENMSYDIGCQTKDRFIEELKKYGYDAGYYEGYTGGKYIRIGW